MSDLLDRLMGRDATLWPPGNVSPTRLGWLDIAERMVREAADLTSWATKIDAERTVLIGMGGSSLGPEVLRAAAGSNRLVVLDTTDPKTVASVPAEGSLFIVSSKSGTTLEVETLLAHFWAQVPDGRRYIAVTDPGTPLAKLAQERNFSRVFTADPNIGGRYSVLSYFGLVPGAVAGVDVAALCERAIGIDREEAVALGMRMGQAALAGRDKVTIVVPERFRAFGLWIEQLIAESTGKHDKGCIPVPTTEEESGPDRNVEYVNVTDVADIGAQFFRWEIATAIAGHVLGIDPFDEPNVTESKENTKRVLSSLPLPDVPSEDPGSTLAWLEQTITPGDYVSLQAYLPYGQDDALEALRRRVRDKLGGVATTQGYGPRFLHSTGQLHKGGPNKVIAVQIVPRHPTAHVPIPDHPYDFATLIAAQSIGDLQSLQTHGRRVRRVAIDALEELG